MPLAISSLILSEIITLASTAIPSDKIIPAIPGNVKVNCGAEIAKSCNAICKHKAIQLIAPDNL